jgi:hypothetical protein
VGSCGLPRCWRSTLRRALHHQHQFRKEESLVERLVFFLPELSYSLRLMSDWLILLVVVPTIVVPVVLLCGFAGCSFQHGVLRDRFRLFEASGATETMIKLT